MRHFFLVLLLVIAGCRPSPAQQVAVDGRFADWDSLSILAADPSGDAGASGVDFTRLQAHDDAAWLYLSFDTGIELLLQGDNGIRLAIDTDNDAATGQSLRGIGAELVWDFAQRQGTVRLGGTEQVRHDDIRLVPAPSMTSTRFELAIRKNSSFNGRPLFPSSTIRFLLTDASGDALPDGDGGVEYTFVSTGIQPGIEYLLRDAAPGSLRVLTWNTLFNGLTDPQRQGAFVRLLRAMKPDVLCFQECFEMAAGEALAVVRSTIDAPAGREWRAIKRDAGNILVTHLEIENSWLLQSEYRESAYLLRTAADETLLLLNAHFRCCDADDHRQREADGVIRFLRDAKLPGGMVTVPEGTPFVLVGDLNLVGRFRQYETLRSGDIENNAGFGPDTPPDWDGGPWTELEPRHPSSLFTFTWDDDGSSYAPGKLDYIFYTASVLEVTQDLVVDPRQISPGQRQRLGLNESDARVASDHLPRFADFRWKQTSAVAATAPVAWNIGDIYPNPAGRLLTLAVTGVAPGLLRLQLSDLLGRNIVLPAASYTSGHLRQLLPVLTPGVYMLAVTDGFRRVVRTVMIR